MKYRFNESVIFDDEMGTLEPSDLSDEPVAISNPTKRLLLLLIAYHGEPVSREVIFKKVWDDYGMISSNNNLNQCVSKLRKVIKVLGINDEVIATVPKLGFMLHQEITIETDRGENGAFIPYSAAEAQTRIEMDADEQQQAEAIHTSDTPLDRPRATGGRSRYSWGIISAIVASALIIGIGIAVHTTGSLARENIFLGNISSCKVFISSTTAPGAVIKQDILDFVESRKVQCSPDEYLLFVRNNQVRSYISGVDRIFLLRCATSKENKIDFCSGLESDESVLVN